VVLAPSTQNNLIASGSDDFTVRIWDGTSGENRFTYQGHTTPVLAMAWSPAGTNIASGSNDTIVQLWNGHTGYTLFT